MQGMTADKSDTLFADLNEIKSGVFYSNKAIYVLNTTTRTCQRKRETYYNNNFRYVRNRINKVLGNQLEDVKAALIKVINGLKDGTEITKEQHIASKQILSLLKERKSDYETKNMVTSDVLSLFSDVISLAYDFEKKVRLKLYSNTTNSAKKTSPFTKAVSSVSMRNTARAMYVN
jgi:hypothetical protein